MRGFFFWLLPARIWCHLLLVLHCTCEKNPTQQTRKGGKAMLNIKCELKNVGKEQELRIFTFAVMGRNFILVVVSSRVTADMGMSAAPSFTAIFNLHPNPCSMQDASN